MATATYLFDVGAYSQHGRRARRPAISPPVWQALQSLKRTMEELPEQELARRRRAFEALERSSRRMVEE